MRKKHSTTVLTNEELWQAILAEAEIEVSRANFHTWFRKTALTAIQDGIAHIAVPNNFVREWLEAKYRRFILKGLRAHKEGVRDVLFVIQKSISEGDTPAPALPEPQAVVASTALPLKTPSQNDVGLNTRYTFASFVVGPSNELAHAAAVSVTKRVGKLYNPLFIYGGVGLGKTHLLQAIGNHVIREQPDVFRIRYISSERFVRDFVTAIRTRTEERYKNLYRSLDLLIIDDIQFIGGKDRSQEELFHTFNELSGREAQIVFSSDRPPHAIPGLADRLRSRFEGGMIADIQPPDFETRVAILQIKARERGLELKDEAAQLIAKIIERNIRELEGALLRVFSHGALRQDGSGDPAKIQDALRATLPPPERIAFRDVVRAIGQYYDLSESDLFEKSRRQEIVRPRQVAMYLCRELMRMSYPAIGKRFNGLDHTTVMHACERIRKELDVGGTFADEVVSIQNILRTPRG